jgi:hypothetical protein
MDITQEEIKFLNRILETNELIQEIKHLKANVMFLEVDNRKLLAENTELNWELFELKNKGISESEWFEQAKKLHLKQCKKSNDYDFI